MQPAVIELEGANGDWFRLSGPGMGAEGVELATDPKGIYDAPVTTIWNSHAFQDGATYGGKRVERRDIVFGVHVFGDASTSWEEADSRWRKAWSYDADATLWIETQDSRRALKLRISEAPGYQPKNDSRLAEYGQVTMTCVAGDPWWWEADVTDTWVAGAVADTGTVTVSNPTDQPIWLRWMCQAADGALYVLPDFSFGNDDRGRADVDAQRVIHMPALQAGEHIAVDSSPQAINGQVNSSTDTQVYLRMKGQMFVYPVPPYTPPTELPVSVSAGVAGVGVQVRCPRPWSRPWGLH